MKVIALTWTQDGIRIDGPMSTTDGTAGSSGHPELYTSLDLLSARLRYYDFTNDEIALDIQKLKEKGELNITLPLEIAV
jgi:hypothetical protein